MPQIISCDSRHDELDTQDGNYAVYLFDLYAPIRIELHTACCTLMLSVVSCNALQYLTQTQNENDDLQNSYRLFNQFRRVDCTRWLSIILLRHGEASIMC